MLQITNLTCGYGDVRAVEDVSFEVNAGEVFGLIGANGAGKTSTIMAIAGLLEVQSGEITLDSESLHATPAHKRSAKGLALVPEGRRVFADLTVDENLTVGGTLHRAAELESQREQVFDIFPRLKERKNQFAGSLSGGEQQMLAMGRGIMVSPKVLLVDELSLGLMPTVIDECYNILEKLRQSGIATLLVEQNTERVLDHADRVAVMESGKIVWSGTGTEAKQNDTLLAAYLGGI